jgi:hypothetical protein
MTGRFSFSRIGSESVNRIFWKGCRDGFEKRPKRLICAKILAILATLATLLGVSFWTSSPDLVLPKAHQIVTFLSEQFAIDGFQVNESRIQSASRSLSQFRFRC